MATPPFAHDIYGYNCRVSPYGEQLRDPKKVCAFCSVTDTPDTKETAVPAHDANALNCRERLSATYVRGAVCRVPICAVKGMPPETKTTPEGVTQPAKNVLEEAAAVIYGDRHDDYGDARVSFQRIADLWGITLGHIFTAEQVALCLIQLKIARAMADVEAQRQIKRDTIVDIAGYAGCLGKLQDAVRDQRQGQA